MIAKQIKGSGFRGVLNYMEAKVNDGVGQLLYTNMLGLGAHELSKEFGIIRSLKPNLQKVVYHAALSIGHDEKLTDNEFVELATDYLSQMGFENSQYAIYRHYDKEHPHIHIIANRVDMDGKVVSDKWDYKRSENIVRALELKFELQQIKSSSEAMESSLSKGQVELYRRTQTIPVKKQLQIAVGDALATSINIDDFRQKLAGFGVGLKLHENSNNQIFGASFELDGIAFKGSTIGRGYSFKKINEKLNHNHERNRRSSQEISRREKTDTRKSNRQNSENQFDKYRITEFGNEAYSNQSERIIDGLKTGNSNDSRAANQINENSAFSGSEHQCSYHQNGNTQEIEFIDRYQNDTNSHPERINDGSNYISDIIPIEVINNRDKDEDNQLFNRKKKKKINRDLERSI